MADNYNQYQDEQQYDGEIIEGSDDGEFSDSMTDNASLTQSGQKAKHKRRSKNDNQGRDFRCGCSKRYLSYPALYTHIKTKHGGQTPSGTNTSQFQTGRGRGRPRKITKEVDYEQKQSTDNQGNAKGSKHNNGPLAGIEEILRPEKLHAENKILERLDVIGGPTNTHEWFADPVDADDVLYQMVQEQNALIFARLRQMNIDFQGESKIQRASIYLMLTSDEEKQHLKIDQILAIYLNDLSEHVIVNFFKTAAVFVELYRNCLNEVGWDKLANYKRLDMDSKLPLFTEAKDADLIPEFCNDFIINYLPMKCNVFDRHLAIELVKHLCIWLHNRNLTQYKISKCE